MPEAAEDLVTPGVSPELECNRYSDEGWAKIRIHLPVEMALTIFVNGLELVTTLCTPSKLNCLALGYLYSEGIISSVRDVAGMRICEDDSLADIRLKNADYRPSAQRTITSGCGAGSTSRLQGKAVESGLVIPPTRLTSFMQQLQDRSELYRTCGGVHASALCDATTMLVMAEDIGRHNTVDKIQGECLLRGIPTADCVLLSTGRISSEMVLKASRMEVPIVVSRTSPTERAVLLARELGIAVVGYARAGRLMVYSHPERLGRREGSV